MTFKAMGGSWKVRQHDEVLPILVRALDVKDLDELDQAGATDVIPETLEASLVMGAQLLLLMGVPTSRVESHTARIRRDQYRPMHGVFGVHKTNHEDAYTEELRTLHLPEDAFAVGRSLSELQLHRIGVQLLAVRRGGIRVPEPTLDTSFRAGDALVIYGRPEDLARAEQRLFSGEYGA